MPPIHDMPDPIHALLTAWFGALLPWGEAWLRLGWAALVGAIVGFERQSRGYEAGLRTCLLVSLGSGLAVVTSIAFAGVDWGVASSGELVRVDPARIAYGVMGGVGFLGAGTIIQHKSEVRGLTTAAAVWCVAALGLAAGTGLYTVSLAGSGMVLVTLTVLHQFERALPAWESVWVTVRVDWGEDALDRAEALFKKKGLRVMQLSLDRTVGEGKSDIQLEIRQRRNHPAKTIAKIATNVPGLQLRRIKPSGR